MATTEMPQPRPAGGRVTTLKRRPEFLRIRKGARFATPSFVLEAKRRDEADVAPPGPRFGFTVSKQVGKAVDRNRIKRRLKAAVRDVVRNHSKSDFDYVVIARRPALDIVFTELVSDLIKALGRVHAKPGTGSAGRQPARVKQSGLRG